MTEKSHLKPFRGAIETWTSSYALGLRPPERLPATTVERVSCRLFRGHCAETQRLAPRAGSSLQPMLWAR